MACNPKVTSKYPSLVIPGYIYSAKGEPLTVNELQDIAKTGEGNKWLLSFEV
jgi:hypothetical protein